MPRIAQGLYAALWRATSLYVKAEVAKLLGNKKFFELVFKMAYPLVN